MLLHPKPKGRNHHHHSLSFMSMKSSSSEIEMSPLESNPRCCCLLCALPQSRKKMCNIFQALPLYGLAWLVCFPSLLSAPRFSAMQGKILIVMRDKSESQPCMAFDHVNENFPGAIRLHLSLHKFWEQGSAKNSLKHELRHK